MEAEIFKRPRYKPPTAPRSAYLESVLRCVPIKELTTIRRKKRLQTAIESRREHRTNGDIDDLQQPPKARPITNKTVSPLLPCFTPDMFKTDEEIELERWEPVFQEAFNRMASCRTIAQAVNLYNVASSALIAILNETINAAEIALEDRENAPSCLVEEMERRLAFTASLISSKYKNNTDELLESIDRFFDYTERLNDRGDLLFSNDNAAAFLGLGQVRLKELKDAGFLHPVKTTIGEYYTRSNLDDVARKIFSGEIVLKLRNPPKKNDANAPKPPRKPRLKKPKTVDTKAVKRKRGRPRKTEIKQ